MTQVFRTLTLYGPNKNVLHATMSRGDPGTDRDQLNRLIREHPSAVAATIDDVRFIVHAGASHRDFTGVTP